jgi:DNA-directed RNA polymerase specialized sigma24 family protein
MMELTTEHQEWAKMMAHSARRRWPAVPLDDLYQEALLRLWRLLAFYDKDLNDSWQGFAYKAVYQHLWKKCEQWSTWNHRNATGHDSTPDPGSWDAKDEVSPELEATRRLIAMLAPRHQWVVAQHVFGERTFRSIADEKNVSVAYVHQVYTEAVASMRELGGYMGLPVCCQPETTPSRDSEPSETMSDSAHQLFLFETKRA